MTEYDVIVIGGGVTGRTADCFTARAGLDTAVFDAGSSILRRNAHLENFPGFPAGVNPRLLLDLLREQAERARCAWIDREIVDVDRHPDPGFVVEPAGAGRWTDRGERLILATPGRVDHLRGLAVETFEEDGTPFVATDGHGRTDVDGCYAAGRLAGKPLQAAVAAGHGVEVAVSLLEDAEMPFAFDWSVPEGYFTDRGHDVPPGVEEVPDEERLARERRSLEVVGERFSEPHSDEPDPHPALADDDADGD